MAIPTTQVWIEGLLIDIPEGQSQGYSEITLAEDMELYGVWIFPQIGTLLGDVGKMEVMHPQAGVIGSYSNNAYISPDAPEIQIKIEREEENPALLTTGLKIRFTYLAVDTNGRKCIAWIRLRK